MKSQWQERARPVRLERRYEFSEYTALRDFLDQAAELSEKAGLYPDMGFGKDYLNVTIHAEPDAEELTSEAHQFAQQLDDLGGYTLAK